MLLRARQSAELKVAIFLGYRKRVLCSHSIELSNGINRCPVCFRGCKGLAEMRDSGSQQTADTVTT